MNLLAFRLLASLQEHFHAQRFAIAVVRSHISSFPRSAWERRLRRSAARGAPSEASVLDGRRLGRRAAKPAFPRRAWERVVSLDTACPRSNLTHMHITRISAYRVELPLHEGSYNWSGGKSVSVFDSTVVRVDTDAGITAMARSVRSGRSICRPMRTACAPALPNWGRT